MEPQDFQETLDNRAAEQKELDLLTLQNQTVKDTGKSVEDTIAKAIETLIRFQAQHQPKVEVTNQKLPTSVLTPDVDKVVKALEALKPALQENKPDDTRVIDALNQLNASISKLPTAFPEMPEGVESVDVKNFTDYSPKFDELGKAIKSIDVKPVVNIPEDKPDDYTPIIDALTPVIEAIKSIKIPETPTTDLTPLIIATEAVQTSISNLKFPVANYILPFIDTEGRAKQAPIPLLDKPYDYSSLSNPDANNNYQTITYMAGGSGGTIVRTLALTYDGNSNVTSITRS